MEEATRLNIPISTTPGGSAAVVELIFGFIITYSRQLISLDQNMKHGNWINSVGFGLEGKTIGIIGLGKIGSGVAKVAKAFNMNVLAWGPRLTRQRAEEQGVIYTSLENLLQQSHYVTIAVRSVPETRNLLTTHHFNMMRKDAIIINISRGDILDEDALVHALSEKIIGAAALDVFSHEPLNPDSALLKLDNVILTPHIGWKTDNMFDQFLSISIDNIISYVVHNNPTRIANPVVLKNKR